MLFLTVPTESKWQSFLDAASKLKLRHARAIRAGLIRNLEPCKKPISGAVHSLWLDVAYALQGHVDQLPLEAEEEPPDEATLTHPDNLLEIASARLEAPAGENHHIFLSRVVATVGLFKLLEAERLWTEARELAIDHLIEAATLEREATHMRDLAFRIEREGSMVTAITAGKAKSEKGGHNKNAANKKKRAELVKAYEEYQKPLVKKAKMSKAAKELLDQMPHLGVDDRTVYGWILKHEAAKKPKKLTDHFD